MLIGGIANLIWGNPRSTQDVDVTLWLGETSSQDLIKIFKNDFKFRTGSPESFAKETGVLPMETRNGVSIDLILGQLPYEKSAIERAITKTFHGSSIKVCSPEDLIILKIVSERPKDREDIRGIIKKSSDQLDRNYLDSRVKELSEHLNKPEIWKYYSSCWN